MQFGLALDQLILTGSLRNPKLKTLVSYESNCRDPSQAIYISTISLHTPKRRSLGRFSLHPKNLLAIIATKHEAGQCCHCRSLCPSDIDSVACQEDLPVTFSSITYEAIIDQSGRQNHLRILRRISSPWNGVYCCAYTTGMEGRIYR